MKNVDVTIATKNEQKNIVKCLLALNRSDIPINQVVIIDNSEDATTRLIKGLRKFVRFPIKVVHDARRLGAVRYRQAKACETEWMVFLDADVFVYSDWWKETSEFMSKHPDVGWASGFSDSPISKFPLYEEYLKHIFHKIGSIALSNTLIKRDFVLQSEELLNPNIHFTDEPIISATVVRKGYRIANVKKRICFHNKEAVKEHPKAYCRMGQALRLKEGFTLRGLKKLLRSCLRNTTKWIVFTSESKKLSLTLLIWLQYLSGWRVLGFLKGF